MADRLFILIRRWKFFFSNRYKFSSIRLNPSFLFSRPSSLASLQWYVPFSFCFCISVSSFFKLSHFRLLISPLVLFTLIPSVLQICSTLFFPNPLYFKRLVYTLFFSSQFFILFLFYILFYDLSITEPTSNPSRHRVLWPTLRWVLYLAAC